jgi:hypothetical protein
LGYYFGVCLDIIEPRKSAAVFGYYFFGFIFGGGLGEGETGFYFFIS